ncbi:hypothetical protein Rsub_09470 [Raphidocelis subcapitata]|uniref:DNA-binding protein n=1 Tax=Raphidocelis subcapitata TaxID=307507 RepID=A0A2V0PA41_9CHLO|nr:hypothetical protein Rsub_09470 [Raphidocelis subcapitata]|eukprot:GBF96728.1 hypothetical protein Rsub_09470 [Raphidocelis subcapitata]
MLALRLTAPSVAAYARARQPGRTLVTVRAATTPAKAKPEKIGKGDLKDIVKGATGLSVTDTSKAVDALLDAIMHGVASGKEVAIPGFGSFKPRERKARTGRNPKTGDAINIAARTSPVFTAGKSFKDIVDGHGAAPKQ